jgi:thioredoxin 1
MAGKALEVTDGNFHDLIMNAAVPALVDFWAVWCGPCRTVAPIIEELAEEYAGRAVIGKMDVDQNKEIATELGIQAIPTLLIVKGGQIADRIVGVVDKKSLRARLDATVESPPPAFPKGGSGPGKTAPSLAAARVGRHKLRRPKMRWSRTFSTPAAGPIGR